MALTKSFEEILTAFLNEHDKRKRKKVDKLMKMFAGKEEEVILLLCKRYNVNPRTIDGLELSEEEYELNPLGYQS